MAAGAAALALLLSGCVAEDPKVSASGIQSDPLSKVQDCLRDAGWDAEIAEDGSITTHIPDGQEEEFNSASDKCWELYPVKQWSDLSENELHALYDAHVAMRDCVVDLGIDVPAPPSFQAWMDMDGNWGGYSDVPQDVLIKRWDEINEACPQPSATG